MTQHSPKTSSIGIWMAAAIVLTALAYDITRVATDQPQVESVVTAQAAPASAVDSLTSIRTIFFGD